MPGPREGENTASVPQPGSRGWSAVGDTGLSLPIRGQGCVAVERGWVALAQGLHQYLKEKMGD